MVPGRRQAGSSPSRSFLLLPKRKSCLFPMARRQTWIVRLRQRVPELANAWTAQVGAPISLTKYASTQAPGLFEFYGRMIQSYPLIDDRKRDDGRIAHIVREPVG